MKKSNRVLLASLASVVIVGSICAVSYAAWSDSGAKSASAVGSTGVVKTIGNLRIDTDSDHSSTGNGNDISIHDTAKLYPIDYSGDGVTKYWKFDLSADTTGDPRVMFTVNGALNDGGVDTPSDAYELFWSFDEPTDPLSADGTAFSGKGSDIRVDSGATSATVYVWLEAYSTAAMNANVSLTFSAYESVVDYVTGKVNGGAAPEVEYSYTDGGKQVMTSDFGDLMLARMDADASTEYYAEATFEIADPGVKVLCGMAHTLPGDEPKQWLSSWVDRGTYAEQRNFRSKIMDLSRPDNVWYELRPEVFYNPTEFKGSVPKGNYTPISYFNRLGVWHDIDTGESGTLNYAVARKGAYYYTFINGKYVMSCTAKEFGNAPTVPGIFMQQYNNVDNYDKKYYGGVSVSNTGWITGAAAVRKIDALMAAENKIYPYNKWHESGTQLTVSKDGAKGVNFTFPDNLHTGLGVALGGGAEDAATPRIIFDGDFTVEYDYVNNYTDTTLLSWERGQRLNIWSAADHTESYNSRIVGLGSSALSDGNTVTLFHGVVGDGTTDGKALDEVNAAPMTVADLAGYDTTSKVATRLSDLGGNTPLHFKLSRRIKSDHSEFIMSVTFTKDGAQRTVSRTVSVNTEMTVDEVYGTRRIWAGPMMLMFQNAYNSGEYSNITWTAE